MWAGLQKRELFYLLTLQQAMGKQGTHLLCSVKHGIAITWDVSSQEGFARPAEKVRVRMCETLGSFALCA